MPNLYFAPADVGGDPSPSSARDGRRRIILTASAPQNGKALPHDPETRIGWSLPPPRDLTGVRRVNAEARTQIRFSPC
jgi:hypothetical protein